jgi:hypothetical protein
MLELLTDWLPLLLAGFATCVVLAVHARARRDRADVALQLRTTQRLLGAVYVLAIATRYPLTGDTPLPAVELLADLTDRGWLELEAIIPSTLMLIVAAELDRRGKELSPFVLGLLGGSKR